MANIFLAQPDAMTVATQVERVRLLEDGRPALVLAENAMRPAGGGQPADRGLIVTATGPVPVSEVVKSEGATWVVASGGEFEVGQDVRIEVDEARRRLLSQGHSLTHLMMAAVREVAEGYESKGADISDCGRHIELRFRSSAPVGEGQLRELDRRTRSRIARGLPITITRVRSMEDAARTLEHWRVDPDLNLGGKIRVVTIEGVDANPCSGSHVSSTAEIGPYAVVGHDARPNGLNFLMVEKLAAWTYWF